MVRKKASLILGAAAIVLFVLPAPHATEVAASTGSSSGVLPERADGTVFFQNADTTLYVGPAEATPERALQTALLHAPTAEITQRIRSQMRARHIPELTPAQAAKADYAASLDIQLVGCWYNNKYVDGSHGSNGGTGVVAGVYSYSCNDVTATNGGDWVDCTGSYPWSGYSISLTWCGWWNNHPWYNCCHAGTSYMDYGVNWYATGQFGGGGSWFRIDLWNDGCGGVSYRGS